MSWLVFLNAPTSALTAVISLAPAIMDEPRRLADLAERTRPGNGATVHASLQDQPHGYAMPITRVREYPAHPLHVLREQIPDFPHPRGHTVIDDDSPLASVYDTFTANPLLREITLSTRTMGTSSMADSTDPSPAGGLRIGACQPPEIMADTEAALAWIEDFARQGADKNVDLLLFPECFLQGYLFDPDHVSRHAMDFTSPAFTAVLRRLAPIEATVVVGVIETEHGRYFNTAAVVTGGRLIGRYRKTRLMPGETIFDPGDTYPTFVQGGVRYGINICSDTQFPEPAAQVAAQGAQVLLVAAQNMLRRPVADQFKDLHHSMRADRARETGMWLVSSDVTGVRGDLRIAYGPTSLLSPRGEVVKQVPLMTTGMIVAEIS